MLLVAAFVVYPFASIAADSLTRWDGISPAQYVGLHNYRVLWGDPVFRLALRNNLLFALSVPIQVVVPLLVAYAIHLRIPGWRLFRATVFLPAVYATVVIGILSSTMLQLDGPVNSALGAVGLQSLEREWLGSSSSSIPLILLIVVWTNFGYNVLLYVAGMSALDPSLEEAARIDGAGLLGVLRQHRRTEPAPGARDRARHQHDHGVRVHVRVHLHDHERRSAATTPTCRSSTSTSRRSPIRISATPPRWA